MNLITSPTSFKFHNALRSLSLSRVSSLPPPPTIMNSSPTSQTPSSSLIQYVVLRRDLIDEWPLGSTVTQACHAAVAAISIHRDRVDTAAYLSASNLDSMTKVTLEVKGESEIRKLGEKLTAEGIEHKLWIERPENIPTCLATRPYPKSFVASYFKKLKLCK